MARCTSCSAPLPANANLCSYCGTRNDVDLHGRLKYRVKSHEADSVCPNCKCRLQAIELDLVVSPLSIERCNACFGLFLERSEIETLLELTVSGVSGINLRHITNINQDRYRKGQKVRYLECPICSILMNRVNYGRRSGVIVDECIRHGIWLESGEITHLMEWKKAGGQLLDKQMKESAKQQLQQQERRRSSEYVPLSGRDADEFSLPDVVSALLSWLFD